jgi:hypothetical protein
MGSSGTEAAVIGGLGLSWAVTAKALAVRAAKERLLIFDIDTLC